MIVSFKDGREFDTESDEDMLGLARALASSESTVGLLKTQLAALNESLKVAVARPPIVIPAPVVNVPVNVPKNDSDTAAVVRAVNDMNRDVKAGLERMVTAQLADTVLVRDSEGDPQRAVKQI